MIRLAPRIDALNASSLAEEPIVRLILDGTAVCVRLDPELNARLPLLQRRCWPRGRGRGMRIGELQRVERVNESGAEIVVALTGREPLCARGQDAANVGRRQFRIAFQQQRYDAAHL